MAEETENFSPLDPLGPAYGKINRPTLDVQGLSPFEGDRIQQAPINFPRPQFHSVMPGVNITQPQQNVRKNFVGYPGVQPDKNNTASDLEVRKAHADFIKGSLQASRPKDQFAKIYSYDAGPDGNAFYDRYMAYGKDKFDQIGFSPLRDNEAVFNSRTTMADDWKRMMTHSFWPLFTSGFTSGPKSLAKMLSGDFTSGDLDEARRYEEAAAIGQSSKGGVMGFMNNTVMNFGYTAGIVSEAILEEAAGMLLAPVTAGGSLWLTTANNLRKVKTVGAAVDGMSAVGKTLSNMATVTGARYAWNAVRRAGTETSLGRFLNPLENTFETLGKLGTDNLTGMAALSKTAGSLYRDVRGINMAISEARLEAGMVENKVYDELYKNYFNENGTAPDNETQQQMMKKAKDASLDTFYKNAVLITASNKITFNNVISPRGGIRNFIKSTVDDVATVGGGKFGNIGKIAYDNAKKSFEFEANNIKNIAKSWWKNPGFKTATKTVGYFKSNFTEGLQENAQEVIAGANERYYIDSFKSDLRQAHEYSMGVADYNMKSQAEYYKEELAKQNPLTAQGFETFASGFFMGMFAAPLNNAIPYLSIGYNRIFDKDAYTDYKNKKIEITENLVNTLNDVKIDDFLKSKLFDYGAQDIIGRIKDTGSKKEALDAEHESLVLSMLGSGVTEAYSDKIRSMNDLDDKEFMDAMNIEKDEIPAYRERVTYAADKMDRIRKTHNYYKDKYPNPVNPEMFKDMDKDSDDYEDMVSLHYGWDLAVKNAVFFSETFEDTKSRLNDVENKFLKSVNREKTGLRELGLLLSDQKLAQELNLLETEINSLKGIPNLDKATQNQLRKKEGLAKNIDAYLNSLNDFDNFFNRDQLYELAKKEVSQKLGREATQEEVEKFVDRKIGKLDNEQKQTKVLNNLKTAFSNYAKFVSESNNDFAFNDDLEKAFTLLTDHYKLGVEARKMASYIDFLNNPANMFEVAERNKNWMKSLYERRKTYYSKMVKQQMKVVENNALLNTLADNGIFVALDQFETWQKTGAIPSEFFNNATKQVLVPGTEEYQKYAMMFQLASDLDTEPGVTEEVLDEPVELITPTSIQEVEAALKNLEAKQLVAKGNEYENIDDPNDRYDRISTLKEDFEGANKRAANRGTIIDDMLRGFINGTATKIEDIREIYINHPLKDQTQPFNAEFIRQLFAIFNEVKEIADNRGITLTAKVPTLWGTINGKKYAGTIDLLGIDKSGQVYIIDLKTSSQNRRSHYDMVEFLRNNAGDMFDSIMQKIKAEEKNNILNVKNFTAKEQKVIDQLAEQFKDKVNKNLNRLALYDYSGQDSSQQSGYAELLRQRTGITVKSVTIFPVQVTVEDKVYTKAEANKDSDGKFTMPVEIDRNIFPETPKAKAKAKVETEKRESVNGIDKITFSNPNVKLEGFEIDDNYWNVVTSTDRAKVLVNINGVVLPFYLTTGQAGKGLVPGWYPFFGIGKDGWLNKTDKSDMETYYERYWGKETANIVKSIAEELNTFYGNDPSAFKNDGDPTTTSRPLTTLADKVEDYINSKLSYTPAINDSNARKTLRSNVEQLGKEIQASIKPEAEPTADTTNKKADIEKEVLGSFANTTERVVNSKGPNNGRTIRTELTSKVSSDGQVIVFKSKNTFTDNGDSVATSSASITIEEFKQHFYPMLTAEEIEMFEETLEVYKEEGWDGKIYFKELRVGSSKATNLKGQVNLDIMIGQGNDYVFTLTKKLTNTELAALEGATEGIKVGTARSEKATNKLAKLGFTDLMLENMTDDEVNEALSYNTPEEAREFREAIIDKQRALDIYHPYITAFTLYKNAQLVANQTLLRKDEDGEYVIFADTDDIVVVKSSDRNTGDVTLQKLGSNITLDVDVSELDGVLTFKDQIMTEPEQAEPTITNKKDAAEFTKEGNQILDSFLGDTTAQLNLEKLAEDPDFTLDDATDDLLNDLKC